MQDKEVGKRRNGKQPDTDEQCCSDRSVGSCSELVYHCDKNGAHSQHRDGGDVHNLVEKVTVEAANSEDGYPNIVKLAEDFVDILGVTKDK